MATRRVVVDDIDSGIKYRGSWFQANGQNDNLDNIGNFGRPFKGTSHGVNETASLSYTFTGTAVSVMGTNGGYNTTSTWECLLDNLHKDIYLPYSTLYENNWEFCTADSLDDSEHTITFHAIFQDQTIWFDRIVYSPSSSVNLDSSLIMVDSSDPSVTYGPGWQDMKDIGKKTLKQGANVTVDFSGTSLQWFSFLPGEGPRAPTTATYSVDGGTPMTFWLSGLLPGAGEQYNQLFFEVSGLSPGQHRIEVVHGGNNQTTPLSLVYVIIQNAPAPHSSTSTPGSLSTPTSNSSGIDRFDSAYTEHKGASTGAIAGGAVGGVVVLVAVILFLLLLRRQRKKNGTDHDLNQQSPLPDIVEPFNSPLNASRVAFPAGQSSSYSQMLSGPSPGGKSELTTQGSTPVNSTSQLLGSSRAREAGELGDLPSTNLLSAQSDIPVASTSQSPSNTASQHMMRHEGSNIRLPPPESTLESPPLYTPS